VQKELNETVIRSREEIEERLETEDRQQLGDISDEVYIATHPHPKFHLRVPQAIQAARAFSFPATRKGRAVCSLEARPI